ncbi:hypothetical protein HHA01_26590 [Halomonas halmophila]|uniref:Uncharacterized protein n=1 Tax=Halomonas halmophila TaxID=252 RepID=A0A4Y4F0A7_9GAMM|nr:hypothetical protein HHA01_26590 [Halomonas halmophila]
MNDIEARATVIGQANGTGEGGTVLGGEVAGEQQGAGHGTALMMPGETFRMGAPGAPRKSPGSRRHVIAVYHQAWK